MSSLGTFAWIYSFPLPFVLESKHSKMHRVVFWKNCFSSCCLKTDSIYTWVLGIIFASLYITLQIFFSSRIWRNKFKMLYWEKQRFCKIRWFNNNTCFMFKLCSNKGSLDYVFTQVLMRCMCRHISMLIRMHMVEFIYLCIDIYYATFTSS